MSALAGITAQDLQELIRQAQANSGGNQAPPPDSGAPTPTPPPPAPDSTVQGPSQGFTLNQPGGLTPTPVSPAQSPGALLQPHGLPPNLAWAQNMDPRQGLPPRPGAIKGFLTNFLGGMGQSFLESSGVGPAMREQQRIGIQQQMQDTNEAYRQMQMQGMAQAQQMVDVPQELQSQGFPAQVPQAMLPALIRMQTAQQQKFLTVSSQLAKNGQKLVQNPDGTTSIQNMTMDELPLPAQQKLKLGQIQSQLQQARIDALGANPNTPAGQVAALKLQVQVQNARSQAQRAAAAAGMTQIAAAKFAQDYVSGYTDEQGNVMGLNQARLNVASSKLPPVLAKAYQTFQTSQSRYNVMQDALPKAMGGDQQAMLNLLANHLGMTMGLQPGARMNQAIIHEAEQSAPWLGRINARFDKDGYLSGVVLTPEQMNSMVDLAGVRLDQDARAVNETQDYTGVHRGQPVVPRGTSGSPVQMETQVYGGKTYQRPKGSNQPWRAK